jgi:HlyD family secretion protein
VFGFRSKHVAVAALLLILLLASGVYTRIHMGGPEVTTQSSSNTSNPSRAAFSADVAIPVEGREAVRGTLVLGVSAAGQAEAWRRASVTAQVGGRVAMVGVRENAAVSTGQPVVVVDAAEYQLAVEDAQARLHDAEAKYREMTLFDERIPDADTRAERNRVARSRSGLEGAEVALRRARLDLSRTRHGAPFAGRVASIKVVPGQYVRPGDELLSVVDLDPIRVEVQVLESEVGYLAPGQRARVAFAAHTGESFAGRIETINPVVESGTRTARVTVVVPNPRGRILPGMYARVSLDAREFPDRVLVPRAAVLERDRRTMLFVHDDATGRAKWRYVTTGLANDSLVEIVGGAETDSVMPGETVLTNGHFTLIHDARVQVVENARAAGGRPD